LSIYLTHIYIGQMKGLENISQLVFPNIKNIYIFTSKTEMEEDLLRKKKEKKKGPKSLYIGNSKNN